MVSVDNPDTNLEKANQGSVCTKEVIKSPVAPDKLAISMAGSLPIRSERNPKEMVPTTEPRKKKD